MWNKRTNSRPPSKQDTTQPAKKPRPGMEFEELEPRLLMSADLPIDVSAVLATASEQEQVNASFDVSDTPIDADSHARRELVLVDTDTPDYQILIDELTDGDETGRFEVVVLDNARDGIKQITELLSGYDSLDAVHIISHGEDGSIDLGGSRLDAESLGRYANEIESWAKAFSEQGDLLIYGCNLAASADGQSLVDRLASITGTDVAASDDLTGDAALGGDWDLEYQTGLVETAVAVSDDVTQNWMATLAVNEAPVNSVPFSQATPMDTDLIFSTADGNAITLTDPDMAATDTAELTLSVSRGTLTLNPNGAVGTESLANTTTSGIQANIEIAAAPVGSSVVVWHSDQTGSWEVYAQRYDASGNPVGSEFVVNQTLSSSQTNAAVVMNADGSFIVSWKSSQGPDRDIYARLFDANGDPTTNEFLVNQNLGGDQTEIDIAADDSGNFVIVWETLDSDLSAVAARLYNADGTAATAEFQVNTTETNDQDDPSVAMDADGDFVIVWESNGQDGSGEGVYSRRYDSAGVAQSGEVLVNTTTANGQDQPDVTMDDAGNYVVAWESGDADGKGIYIQRYDAAGSTLGIETQVNTTTTDAQTNPVISSNGAGEFVVAWESNLQDGSGLGVYARRFAADGSPATGEFRLNEQTTGIQQIPAVAMTDEGFLAAWEGEGGGDTAGVFLQQYQSLDLTFSVGDGISDATVTLVGNLSDLNRALEGLTYTPNTSYVGLDMLTITTDDLGNSGTGGAQTDTDTVNIAVGLVNVAPVITSDGGGTTAGVKVVENSTAVTTVTATDADLDTVTYFISGGADAALFSIDTNSGVLTFNAAPDFENPGDSDNVYVVAVTADDGRGDRDVQTISVTVTNVSPTTISTSGAATVESGSLYTLNLSANEDVTAGRSIGATGRLKTLRGIPPPSRIRIRTLGPPITSSPQLAMWTARTYKTSCSCPAIPRTASFVMTRIREPSPKRSVRSGKDSMTPTSSSSGPMATSM